MKGLCPDCGTMHHGHEKCPSRELIVINQLRAKGMDEAADMIEDLSNQLLSDSPRYHVTRRPPR